MAAIRPAIAVTIIAAAVLAACGIVSVNYLDLTSLYLLANAHGRKRNTACIFWIVFKRNTK